VEETAKRAPTRGDVRRTPPFRCSKGDREAGSAAFFVPFFFFFFFFFPFFFVLVVIVVPPMITLRLDGAHTADLDTAAQLLREGGLVAMPTETVYGLAARALDEECVSRIFHAKGRPSDNPLILHVASFDDARPLWDIDEDSRAFENARALALHFWPGPLTLVLPSSSLVPLSVRGGLPKVAVRVPRHDVAHALLARVGEPLAAPSANASGRVSPTTAADVLMTLDGRIDAVLDGGACAVGLESTVVDVDDDGVTILRPGVVTREMLRAVVPDVRERDLASAAHQVPSPGVRHRHYAPDIVEIAIVDDEGLRACIESRDAILARAETLARMPMQNRPRGAVSEALPDDVLGFSRALYAALYRIERAKPEALRIERLPDDDAWRAVRDRVVRAASRD
jgi:L-threonylcarbamoyladenylate synthase